MNKYHIIGGDFFTDIKQMMPDYQKTMAPMTAGQFILQSWNVRDW
jgi:hypothetical protein